MKYDWVFKSVKLFGIYANENGMGFRLSWDSNMGFGQLDFDVENGKLLIDDETLGRELVIKILEKFVSDGKLVSEANNE